MINWTHFSILLNIFPLNNKIKQYTKNHKHEPPRPAIRPQHQRSITVPAARHLESDQIQTRHIRLILQT